MDDPPIEKTGKPEQIQESHLVICEGPDDQAFFHAFLLSRTISGVQVIEHAGGKNGFGARLNALDSADIQDVRAILLVVDNDGDPRGNFIDVCEQIEETGRYAVPKKRREFVSTTGRPKLGILTIPGVTKPYGTQYGNIETLLMRIFESFPTQFQRVVAAQDFVNRTVPHWSPSPQAKVRLRCVLATNHRRHPLTRVNEMWQEKKDFRWLLKSPLLNDLEDFLREFANI